METKVTLTEKDIFKYLVYYLYMGVTGFLYIFVGVGAVACAIYFLIKGNNMGLYLLVFAFIYLALQPYVIYLKAKKNAKNPYFAKPTTYIFDLKKITYIMQDRTGGEILWENLYRVVRFSDSYYIFLDRDRGHIVTMRSFEDPKEFESFLKKLLPPKKLKGIK